MKPSFVVLRLTPVCPQYAKEKAISLVVLPIIIRALCWVLFSFCFNIVCLAFCLLFQGVVKNNSDFVKQFFSQVADANQSTSLFSAIISLYRRNSSSTQADQAQALLSVLSYFVDKVCFAVIVGIPLFPRL